MIAFAVDINGERVCTAGVEGLAGVLSATLNWVRRESGPEGSAGGGDAPESSLTFSVAGHARRDRFDFEHLEWIQKALSAGDEIAIRIVETERVDPPTRRRRSGPGAAGTRRPPTSRDD